MTKNIDKIQDFDCNKNTAIEASAGTGKTYTITKIIVPKLLRDTSCSLSNILIVTYTDKAAGELRSRIRSELQNIVSLEPDGKFKEKIERELETIDSAPISTFHSFCQKILTENAVYTNYSKNMTLIDENVALDNFVGRYIRDVFPGCPEFDIVYNDGLLNVFQDTLKDAIKKYYLDTNGNEDKNVVSLHMPERSGKESVYDMMGRFISEHLKDIYITWQKDKAEKNIQTYTDIIKTVHDAIINDKHTELLALLKDKYKYAIIDEFQDTNQLEWDIFKQIFTTDDEHHITIVGDPKQSIYSFQNADSMIYDSAKKYIETHNGQILSLNINYRSSNSMIDAINVLAKSPAICNYSSDKYQNIIPASDNDKQICSAKLNDADIKPVHFLNAPAEDVIVSKIIEYCTQDSNGKTALQIWDNKQYRNVNFDDFAVLVRNRNHANKLIIKMKKAGIPVVRHKDTSLFSDKEAKDWVALLTAIQSPDFNAHNRNLLRQALQTNFFDISLDEISNDKFNDIVCRERQILLKWHILMVNRQFTKLITDIFAESGITERLASYDKIQSLSKYNQIGNFILDCLTSKNASVGAVIKALKQNNNKGEVESEKSVEMATDNPTVKVSTIHSAKGLEFSIVFYFIYPPKESTEHVHIVHRNDETSLQIQPTSVKTNEPDWVALRYVAITRAKSLMFIINSRYYKKTAIDPNFTEFKDSDLFEISTTVSDTYKSAANILNQNSVCHETDEKAPCDYINLAYKKLYKHSYTSLSHHQSSANDTLDGLSPEQSQRIDKDETDSVQNIYSTKEYDANAIVKICDGMYASDNVPNMSAVSSMERGTSYGTIIHEIFEQIDFQEFETNNYTEYAEQIIYAYCKKCLISHTGNYILGICDKITSLLKNTMTATFPEIIGNHATGKTFKLCSISPENKKSEIEFNLNTFINKSLLNYYNGFIDLLFVREIDGKKVYSILDWKTDFLNGTDYADYDCLKAHTDDNYSIQRVLYSYCLIQWLKQFYPGMSESDIFDKHFGGIYYVYVRGCSMGTGNGIYAHTWENYDALQRAIKNIENIIKGKH